MTRLPSTLKTPTLLAVSLSVGAAYTGIGMVVPVRVLYAQAHGASLSIIGAMASAYLVSNFIFQFPVGALADRFGRKPVLLVGFAWQVVVTLSYLAVSDPLVFVLLRFLDGLGGAAVLPAARALVADATPEDRRGEAYGVFGAFFNAGFLLGPAVGGLVGGIGYGPVFVGSVVCRFGALVLVWTLVREHGHNAGTETEARVPARSLFSPALAGAYIMAFADYLWLGFDLTVGTLWLRYHIGASLVLIGLTYAVWSVPAIVVSPLGGRLADRSRRWRLILLFGLAQVPFFAAYALMTAIVPVMILMFLQSGLYSVLQPAADSYLAFASPREARARTQSLATTAGLISAFCASTLLPLLYGIDYRIPFLALDAVFALCVLVGVALIRQFEERAIVASTPARASRSAQG